MYVFVTNEVNSSTMRQLNNNLLHFDLTLFCSRTNPLQISKAIPARLRQRFLSAITKPTYTKIFIDNINGVTSKQRAKYSNFRVLKLNIIFTAVKTRMLQNAIKINILVSCNVTRVRQPMAQSKHSQFGKRRIAKLVNDTNAQMGV